VTHRIHLLALTALLTAAGPIDAAVRPVRLRCEHLPQPFVDIAAPQFSWALVSDQRDARQTAYQIRVATTPERLHDNPDLWDSGKVASGNTLGIVYAGKPLRSNTTVYWTVRAWDAHDQPADAAEPARFDVALLDPSEWKAKWIADPRPPVTDEAELYRDRPAPMFRHEFTAKGRVRRARALVSGLGYYDLHVNGRRINADRLEPNWTSFGKRVPYAMYDVSDVIAPGPNALGVIVGNGWYNPLPLRMWGWLNLREHLAIGQPRVILQLHIDYEDGTQETIVTDERWRVGESPILHNSIYLGEVYDARREIDGWDRPGFDDRDWPTAVIAREPVGTLRAATVPSVRQVETIRPVKITEPRPGVFIVDMGRNLAGTITLRVRGRAGQTITLRYGELLYPDGRLNVMTSVCG